MHFLYQGFTHHGNVRSFSFRGLGEYESPHDYSFDIDLRLLLEKGVPVQEAPMFCLQILKSASTIGDPQALNRFQGYVVADDDFRPLLIEREKRAAEKALSVATRRSFRKLGKPNEILAQ